MNIQDYRSYCLDKPGTEESFPFDKHTLVFKVAHKILALTNVDEFNFINLKCDAEEAVILRENYSCVIPGYHMNKKHWNTIILDGSIHDKFIYSWVDNSYNSVYNGLTKKQKALIH